MNSVYLLIGGNMGDRFNYLRQAKDAIGKNAGKILETSAIYETEAWGLTNQDKFLNQALKIDTQLNPKDLLHCLLQIEESLGRKREVKYGPRIIDIDILFYGNEIVSASFENSASRNSEPPLCPPMPAGYSAHFLSPCITQNNYAITG